MTKKFSQYFWNGTLLPKISLLCLMLSFISTNAHATIIGNDERKKVDINDARAFKVASRTPSIYYCGSRFTTGILTRLKGDDADYLLLSAHHLFNGNGKFNRYDSNKNGVYDKGDKRCSLKDLQHATIAFNLVFLGTRYDKFARSYEKNIIDGQPINLKDASNYNTTGEDVLIVKLKRKVSQDIMPNTGKKRGYSKFLPAGNYKIKKLNKKSFNIAYHADTDFNVMKNDGCQIRRFNVLADPRVSFKSKCDAEPGSSNSPLFITYKDEPAIWGMVIGGPNKSQPENTKTKNWVSIKTAEFLVKEYHLVTTETM